MTPEEFFKAVKNQVDAVTPPHVQVTLGEPPDYPEGHMIHPYVIIWPTPGTALDERLVDGRMGQEATDISFQATAAGPDPLSTMQVTADLAAALQDTVIGGSIIRADTIANREARPIADDTVRPVRYYTATTWQTQLTRSLSA